MAVEVILPRVDMDMTTGKITKWFVAEGNSVAKGQPLFEIESDKAAMEVESSAAGVLRGVTCRPGDEAPVGAVLGWIVAPGENFVEPKFAAVGGGVSARRVTPIDAAAADEGPGAGVAQPLVETYVERGRRATPKARRLARERELPLSEVVGSGPSGRIQACDVVAAAAKRRETIVESAAHVTAQRGVGTNEDVDAPLRASAPLFQAEAAAPPEVPVADFARFGPVEIAPLSRIKRISGPRLHASWFNIPHVTHTDEADISELEAFRTSLDEEARGDKETPHRVSLMPFVIKCTAAALKAFPIFNSALLPSKDALVYRHYRHIGVAVDTADGLVVAVVRDADRKGVKEITRELVALSAKAREGKLTPAEMQGATFTISSLGGIGGVAFTPIVNAPEVAILGVVRAKTAPVWDGAAFQPRLILPLCLSYDHRVIDGAAAARFLRHLSELLKDVRRVLL